MLSIGTRYIVNAGGARETTDARARMLGKGFLVSDLLYCMYCAQVSPIEAKLNITWRQNTTNPHNAVASYRMGPYSSGY